MPATLAESELLEYIASQSLTGWSQTAVPTMAKDNCKQYKHGNLLSFSGDGIFICIDKESFNEWKQSKQEKLKRHFECIARVCNERNDARQPINA